MEYALLGICLILILLPPKYDPAIRIKEYQEKKRKQQCHTE